VKQGETRIRLAEAPVPGAKRVLDVGGHQVGLFNVAGSYYALADRCPHRGAPLCSRGEIVGEILVEAGKVALVGEGEYLRCPWHKWDFEIATGASPVAPWLRVRRYPVRVEGVELVVTLDSVKDL
jgi:3-phenylpropionate/trans-cinnamate dioxygenase ferredoxin subunit